MTMEMGRPASLEELDSMLRDGFRFGDISLLSRAAVTASVQLDRLSEPTEPGAPEFAAHAAELDRALLRAIELRQAVVIKTRQERLS